MKVLFDTNILFGVDGKPVGGKAPDVLARLHGYLWDEFIRETE